MEEEYVYEENERAPGGSGIGKLILGLVTGIVLGAVFMSVGLSLWTRSHKTTEPEPTLPSQQAETDTEAGSIYERLDQVKLQEVLDLLEERFLYDIDEEALENAIFHSLMESLDDPYACYYNAEEYEELWDSNEGSYYGIGVMVSQNLETYEVTVTRVFRDSPALESGMLAGDVLTHVADTDVRQMLLDDIVALIKGEEGSTVRIQVNRPGVDAPVVMDVERRRVEQDMVYWDMLEEGIGYIELLQFTSNAPEQLAQALADLTARGMKGLILDLRDNPGGLLGSVIAVGDQLLPGGVLLTIKSSYEPERVYKVKDSGFDLPLVVLCNEYSASASEVLIGAIRDYEVGTIVGINTYGKGIVQDIYTLSDGVTGIKFTTADYYTPLGHNIHGQGIAPDVEVAAGTEQDDQLIKALDVLKEKMK